MQLHHYTYSSDSNTLYQKPFNKYKKIRWTVFFMIFINAIAFFLVIMSTLSNQWITVINKAENITYCSGHYFGCVLHNKKGTYICSPHIMYMRQTTFTHGVGHHPPEWLIQRIRRFHYFSNFFKLQKSTNHTDLLTKNHNISLQNSTIKDYLLKKFFTKKHKNDSHYSTKSKQFKQYIDRQIEKFILTIPISQSTTYLMIDTEHLNQQLNITGFLDNITHINKPLNNITTNTSEFNPNIKNQDDLLLISELLMLNNSLLIVPMKEVYYHLSDDDTSSALLSIKISFLMCSILLVLSAPIYITIGCCIYMKSLVTLAIILGYQSVIGFTFLAPFAVYVINVFYDIEYYIGETQLEIGFGNSIYVAIATLITFAASILIIFVVIGVTVRYQKSFKYIRLIPD